MYCLVLVEIKGLNLNTKTHNQTSCVYVYKALANFNKVPIHTRLFYQLEFLEGLKGPINSDTV